MRKKIVKVVPFSPNVEKVFYSNGTWGLRSAGSGYAGERSIPDQGREGNAIAWQDSMDGEPASPDEIEDLLSTLRKDPGTTALPQGAQPLPTKKGI